MAVRSLEVARYYDVDQDFRKVRKLSARKSERDAWLTRHLSAA
jgi:hypothetical protein